MTSATDTTGRVVVLVIDASDAFLIGMFLGAFCGVAVYDAFIRPAGRALVAWASRPVYTTPRHVRPPPKPGSDRCPP